MRDVDRDIDRGRHTERDTRKATIIDEGSSQDGMSVWAQGVDGGNV